MVIPYQQWRISAIHSNYQHFVDAAPARRALEKNKK